MYCMIALSSSAGFDIPDGEQRDKNTREMKGKREEQEEMRALGI